MDLVRLREKTARQNVFHFAGAIGENWGPRKTGFVGYSTVGLSYERPEGV